MPTQTEEIVVRFKTEGGQEVEQTLNRTADASDLFHQKVSKAGGALGDLRLKAEARVANNIGAIATALTGGASAGEVFATAITKVSESFRGSLLFAGAATVGFALYEGITKAGEAAIALDTKLLNLRRDSSLGGDFLGSDKIAANLTAALGAIDELRARFVRENTGLGGAFNQALRGASELRTRPQLEARDAQQIADARKAGLDALDQTATKLGEVNAINEQLLLGDEKQAALKKIENDHNERSLLIAKAEAQLGITSSNAQGEEINRFNLETAAVEKQFEQRQFQLDLERDLAQVQTEFLTPQRQSLSVAEAQEKSIERQLQTLHFLTDQERQRLNTAKASAVATETRALVQGATSPLYRFNAVEDRSVANRLAFEQEKLASDPNAPDNADRVRHIKELQLFQDNQRLNDLNDVRNNTINFGASGRDLDARQNEQASNLRARIKAERASLGLRAADEQDQSGGTDNTKLINDLATLIQTLNALPAKIGVQ